MDNPVKIPMGPTNNPLGDPVEPVEVTPAIDQASTNSTPPPKNKSWVRHHFKLLLILAVISIAAAASAAVYVIQLAQKPAATTITPAPTPTPTPTPVPTPVLKASPLSGELIEPALADRAIRSIIVENHPDARPQSGLSDAGVVYEALAEGGITRFQTFFLDKQPKAIGPVRSLRTYFIDWGLEFNSPVAHAGGSADALALVKPLGMKDLNALAIGAPTFYRTKDRYAPHNMYTSSVLMDAILTRYKFNQPANFTVSPRQADKPLAAAAHPNIHINYSYNGYQVDYMYNATTNDYARSLAGKPHLDRNTGTQIHVKNVVVEYMPTTFGATHTNGQEVTMATVGSGKVVVFRDGDAIEGTWSKASRNARTILKDAAGVEIPLNIGNTWYSIVPVGKIVTY